MLVMNNFPWLKSYPKELKWDANIEAKAVHELFDNAVKSYPKNPCVDFLDNIMSYEEVDEKVEKLHKALLGLKLEKGAKIGIYLPNCPQFVISYFAILKAGFTVVNYSPLYSESELKHQLEDSDTEVLITTNLKLLYPKANSLLNKNTGKLKKLIISNFDEYMPSLKGFLFKLFKGKDLSKVSYSNDIINWNDFLKNADNDLKPYISTAEDTAIIQYTGGTTGVPKGAELTHKNIYVNAIQCKLWCMKATPDGESSFLTVLPLFHVFAMTTAMNLGISCAAKLILHPRFDLKNVLKDIDRKKPTHMPGVPTMYNAINNSNLVSKYDLKSLRVCVSGGGPLPAEVKKTFEAKTGCSLIEGYGLTETSPVVTCNPIDGEYVEGSIGLPFPDTEILIEDIENRGKFLSTNEKGEVCIKGPQVMKGYYKRQQATEETIIDGILRTGDIGLIDSKGYTHIVDRLKEMIIVGGFKVYPRHVEEVIYQHPSVLECAVIGVEDSYSGERVKAFIVLKKGQKKNEEELKNYFKSKLAKHEVPKIIEFADDLPKSPVGKILKKELS
jgi:long-chain acyl-CoA synthetase